MPTRKQRRRTRSSGGTSTSTSASTTTGNEVEVERTRRATTARTAPSKTASGKAGAKLAAAHPGRQDRPGSRRGDASSSAALIFAPLMFV